MKAAVAILLAAHLNILYTNDESDSTLDFDMKGWKSIHTSCVQQYDTKYMFFVVLCGMSVSTIEVKDEQEVAVFRPEECVSFAEALWMYTVGAAYAANCEHVLGQVCNGCDVAALCCSCTD